MNHDEDMILGYLRKFPNAFVSAMEICKRAGDRKRFASEPDWAKPVLVRMTQQRVLECNVTGQYRIKPEEEDEEPKKHGRPYEPRPEPTPAPEVVTAEQKAETLPKPPPNSLPSGEAQNPPSQVGGNERDVAGKSPEAKSDPIPQVDASKEAKTQTPPLPRIGGYKDNKKAA
jgi:hypothetical protein